MSRKAASDLTALDHLRELWIRALACIGAILIGGTIAYAFRLKIIPVLQHPLKQQLYYLSPAGSFQFIMQLCLLVGMIIGVPVIAYNLLRFISPALPRPLSQRFILGIVLASFGLALAGVGFGYVFSLPLALHFFTSVGGTDIQPLISVNQYFGFVTGYLTMFAVIFQLPLLLLLINRITPFKPGGLKKWRKFVYVGAVGIALIIPFAPDPMSQIIIAIPAIILYELSAVLIWAINTKHRKAAKKSARVELSSVSARHAHEVAHKRIQKPKTAARPAFAFDVMPVTSKPAHKTLQVAAPKALPTSPPRVMSQQRGPSMDGFVGSAQRRVQPRTAGPIRPRPVMMQNVSARNYATPVITVRRRIISDFV